jgi:hypothetical protein
MMGTIGAIWGILGVTLILGRGLLCIYPYSTALCGMQLGAAHWAALAVSLLFMGYAEGYKGFQLKFSPRVAARALYIRQNPTLARVVFAPLFCMGYFHATKKRKIISYALTLAIVLLIIGVGHMSQPWRGIVDAGVLLGLGWGVVSVWIYSLKALLGKNFDVSPETPDA